MGRYNRLMSEPETPLREQLDAAIARVRRELEILISPSTIGAGADNRGVIHDLEVELKELREARSGLVWRFRNSPALHGGL